MRALTTTHAWRTLLPLMAAAQRKRLQTLAVNARLPRAAVARTCAQAVVPTPPAVVACLPLPLMAAGVVVRRVQPLMTAGWRRCHPTGRATCPRPTT